MAPASKQAATSRQRAPSSLSQVATPPTSTSKSKKTSKPSLVVLLKLSPSLLSRFAPASVQVEPVVKKKASRPLLSTQSSSSAPVKAEDDASVSAQGSDEVNSSDRKGSQETSKGNAGSKRELDAVVDGDDSTKPKLAQRKRPKVGENGRMDGRTAAAKALGYNAAAHKLGPKSNQGVINEKLRALDRSGKPCRKWTKAGFQIKSFTGRMWQVPSWKTPQTRMFGEDGDSQDLSSNDISKANSSSNIGSDRSPGGENVPPSSSPVRIAPAPISKA